MKEMKKRDEVYKIDYSKPTSRYKQRGAVQTEFFDIPTRDGKTVRAQRLVPVKRMPLKEQAAQHKARHPKDVGEKNVRERKMASTGHLDIPTYRAEE